MTTKITEKNISNLPNQSILWQSVITAAGGSSTAEAGKGYIIDTTSNVHTLNLPSTASRGDTISVKDYAGTFATNNLTIGRNGHLIQGFESDSFIQTNRASLTLVYVDSTKGWIYLKESNVANLVPEYISATGGTVTESGDFKYHTFTGDGCFVVSSTATLTAPNSIEYLVVAGGGGGASRHGGGGGAGGAIDTSTTASVGTYGVTVGGGGAGSIACGSIVGTSGSGSSVFSTPTAGGGFGSSITACVGPGGSGGGSRGNCTACRSSGTPGQGTPGGIGTGVPYNGGGGGGGKSGAGSDASCSGCKAGDGGDGINWKSLGTYYAGGGGGGGSNSIRGDGGLGGGGDGNLNGNDDSTAGTANTGGGGGSGGHGVPGNYAGKSGGKGVVIIRYKFQN